MDFLLFSYKPILGRTVALLFCTFFFSNLWGQYDSDVSAYDSLGADTRKKIAAEAVQSIKEGVLIVRLTSNSRKLGELDKLLANESLDAKQKQRLLDIKEATIAETKEENQQLVDAFMNYYKFSDVLFFYDSDIQYLKDGQQSGYFLGRDLTVDSAISLNNRPYVLARYGSRASSQLNERKGVFTMDADNQDIPPPFPHSADKNVFQFVARWFNRIGNTRQDHQVGKFSQRLQSFYESCKEKGLID